MMKKIRGTARSALKVGAKVALWPLRVILWALLVQGFSRAYLFVLKIQNKCLVQSDNNLVHLYWAGSYEGQNLKGSLPWMLNDGFEATGSTLVVELHFSNDALRVLKNGARNNSWFCFRSNPQSTRGHVLEAFRECLQKLDQLPEYNIDQMVIRGVSLLGRASGYYGFTHRRVPGGFRPFWEWVLRVLFGFINGENLAKNPLEEMVANAGSMLDLLERRLCKNTAVLGKKKLLVPEAAQ